jgi:F0F1-type ATP synthase beta subunit
MSEVFSGMKGEFVSLQEAIDGFKALLDGEGDDTPEIAFHMKGTLE